MGGAPSVQDWYLGIYAALVAATIVATLIQGAGCGLFSLRASRRLHDAVFSSILRATPSWFDTQPTGRILARFTGDIDAIDTALPPSLEQSSEYLTQVFLGLILVTGELTIYSCNPFAVIKMRVGLFCNYCYCDVAVWCKLAGESV